MFKSLQDTPASNVDESATVPVSDLTLPPLEGSTSTPATPTAMEVDQPSIDVVDADVLLRVEGGSAAADADATTGEAETQAKEKEGEAETDVKPRDLFAIVAQEKILGLIGALLPLNRQVR